MVKGFTVSSEAKSNPGKSERQSPISLWISANANLSGRARDDTAARRQRASDLNGFYNLSPMLGRTLANAGRGEPEQVPDGRFAESAEPFRIGRFWLY